MKAKFAVFCISLVMMAQTPLALAQSNQLSSDQAWELVKQTALGEKLELKLKDGRKVKGEKVLVSDSELSLTLKNQQAAQFKRDEIRQVWRTLSPDPDKQRFYQGIGTGAGVIAGVSIAVAASSNSPCYDDCGGRGVGIVAAIIGLTIVGALIGRKLAGGKRILIYQAS